MLIFTFLAVTFGFGFSLILPRAFVLCLDQGRVDQADHEVVYNLGVVFAGSVGRLILTSV